VDLQLEEICEHWLQHLAALDLGQFAERGDVGVGDLGGEVEFFGCRPVREAGDEFAPAKVVGYLDDLRRGHIRDGDSITVLGRFNRFPVRGDSGALDGGDVEGNGKCADTLRRRHGRCWSLRERERNSGEERQQDRFAFRLADWVREFHTENSIVNVGAFAWLAKAEDVRSVFLISTLTDPKWEELLTDPRFGAMFARMTAKPRAL
jgi:hypothetical protein